MHFTISGLIVRLVILVLTLIGVRITIDMVTEQFAVSALNSFAIAALMLSYTASIVFIGIVVLYWAVFYAMRGWLLRKLYNSALSKFGQYPLTGEVASQSATLFNGSSVMHLELSGNDTVRITITLMDGTLVDQYVVQRRAIVDIGLNGASVSHYDVIDLTEFILDNEVHPKKTPANASA